MEHHAGPFESFDENLMMKKNAVDQDNILTDRPEGTVASLTIYSPTINKINAKAETTGT